MLAQIALALLSIVFAPQSFAHGESALGPHGGIIRMPGGFHTEVKPEPKPKGSSSFTVYLLDIEFKNPLIEKSAVKATLKKSTGNGRTSDTAFDCTPNAQTLSFYCSTPKKMKLAAGDRIEIIATRNDAPGAPMTYVYPFNTPEAQTPKPQAPDSQAMEHSGHGTHAE